MGRLGTLQEPASSTATASFDSDGSQSSGRTRADHAEQPPAAPAPTGADPEKKAATAATESSPLHQQDQIVGWTGPDDPQNPLNYSAIRKWTILSVLGSATLCVTCASVSLPRPREHAWHVAVFCNASCQAEPWLTIFRLQSMVASTYDGMMEDFNISHEVATLVLSLFIAGLGIGPLVLAPLSEFYGRSPVYLIGYFVFSCFSFLVAFGNFPGILVGRFIQGFAGSAFLSVAGGSVSDLWAGNKVGRPMALYSACPFLGPVLGPVMASFINQSLHWRWTWYISTAWCFAELALIVLLVPETYAPKILKKKAARLRRETGNPDLRSQKEIDESQMGISKTHFVVNSIGRPFGTAWSNLHHSRKKLTSEHPRNPAEGANGLSALLMVCAPSRHPLCLL